MNRSLALAVLTLFAVAGCPGGDPTPDVPATLDAGSDAGPECTTDADCDDGRFCTGVETCTAGRCEPGADPCDDGIDCTIDSCSEGRMRCQSEAPDEDGDGEGDARCLDAAGVPVGDDCDDADPERYPGAAEICDGDDEDCNDATLGGVDDDGDGYVSSACCAGDTCGPDCDDARLGSFPGATEVCDGLDQDCNGTIDDGLLLEGFADADGDGWGGATAMSACPGTPGFDTRGGDCNDDPTSTDARAQNPGQPEICDGIRNDCDVTMDADVGAGDVNWYRDLDGDGFGAAASGVTRSCAPVAEHSLFATDCNDADAMVNPAATERCNAEDDNCDGRANYRIAGNDFEDDDADGLVDLACPGGTDCNDNDPTSGPGEAERCDMRDNDCDAIVDEGATSAIYYRDLDRDGWGSVTSGTVVACMLVGGYVAAAGDCNDADATRFPGAAETCDAADEDCDAAIDEAPASVGCSLPGASASTCVAGRCLVDACVANRDDCNGRASDGCEANLLTDGRNCGECGIVCAGGGLCAAGRCTRSATVVSPGLGLATLTVPRAIELTIDTPLPVTEGAFTIGYTLDGTDPGGPTTVYATAPARFTPAGSATIRWRGFLPSGPEPISELAFVVDSSSVPGPEGSSGRPVDNWGGIVERLTLNGQGPVTVVPPGGAVTVQYDVQWWAATASGYCPTCITYFSVNYAVAGGARAVGQCLGASASAYPGSTLSAQGFSFTAPTVPGVYPIELVVLWDFSCRPVPGTPVGYVIVDG